MCSSALFWRESSAWSLWLKKGLCPLRGQLGCRGPVVGPISLGSCLFLCCELSPGWIYLNPFVFLNLLSHCFPTSVLFLSSWLAYTSSLASKLFLFFKAHFLSFPSEASLVCFSWSWFSNLLDWGPQKWDHLIGITGSELQALNFQTYALCTAPAKPGKVLWIRKEVLCKKRFLSHRALSLFNILGHGKLFLQKEA